MVNGAYNEYYIFISMQVYSTTDINEIAFELRNNKAVILPTDTVWGIISLEEKNIYQIKQRSLSKKIVTFINDIKLLNLPSYMENEISKYWPGGLTIIYKQKGYRIPKSKALLALLDRVGPLKSSSANISGQEPISSVKQALEVFKKWEYRLVLADDKDFKLTHIPSTIIDLDKMIVLRQGAVDGNKILDKIKKGKP